MSSETKTSTTVASPRPSRSTARIVSTMLATAVGMFCFALFIMPPLYEVLCEITGLNGKYTDGRVTVTEYELRDKQQNQRAAQMVDTKIKVQFIADETTDVPWPFYPKTRSLTIEPGTIHQVFFRVENPKSTAVIAQAIPSISPAQASLYLKKTQCFCFNHQPLAPFEGKDMGLVFYVDPEIPDELREVTLSYRLYDITDRVDSTKESNAATAVDKVKQQTSQHAQQPARQSAKGETPNV